MVMETSVAHYVTQFRDTMHVRAQQGKSRLRPYVTTQPMQGEAWAYDGVGPVESEERTERHAQSNPTDIEHWRRKIPRRFFHVTLFSDEIDVTARLSDPKGIYANAAAMAMERRFDRVIYEAMFADVATGRDFSTTIDFATDGGRTVNATGGLTLAKLLEAKQNFTDDEVGNPGSAGVVPGTGKFKKCMGISGDEETTMLQIATLTSGDYSRRFALEEGDLTYAVGIEMIPFGANVQFPVLQVAGGVRTSFVMAAGAMAVGITKEWGITIKDRPDMINVTQIQITGAIGACRTEGKLLQKITTTDL